jgi:hypothetical protein
MYLSKNAHYIYPKDTDLLNLRPLLKNPYLQLYLAQLLPYLC